MDQLGNDQRVIRIDRSTVGISNGELARLALARRPKDDYELTVFKPLTGVPIGPELSTKVMKALAQDVRSVIELDAVENPRQLIGVWPRTGYVYLRSLLYGGDPWS